MNDISILDWSMLFFVGDVEGDGDKTFLDALEESNCLLIVVEGISNDMVNGYHHVVDTKQTATRMRHKNPL